MKIPLPRLRDYQNKLKNDIRAAWATAKNDKPVHVCAISPTGSGKTVTMASITADHQGGAVLIAHRQELVTQISMALNAFRVRHRLIVPDDVRKLIIAQHMKEHGATYYDPSALIAAGGVDSILAAAKKTEHKTFFQSVTLWVNDEAAHVTKTNVWGKALALFPNVKWGLGVTAWSGRADGQGIGSHADGPFDLLVLGPIMEFLIEQGYLTPFQIWTIPHATNYDEVPIGASGEYVHVKLVAAEEHDKKLVGDIVKTYLERVPGKRAICFLSSIKKAEETAQAFRDAGIPAMALDGKTDKGVRQRAAQDLATGKLRVLCNADLFGEGTDIPAVEVVIMGTRTASFSRYLQWFGRMLRLSLSAEAKRGYDDLSPAERRARIAASDKPFGIVIDHAGNVVYHDGPPCGPHVQPSLDRRQKRATKASDAIPYRVCVNKGYSLMGDITWEQARAAGLTDEDLEYSDMAVVDSLPCATPYPATLRCCPACGYMNLPGKRSTPEQVEGDLQLLDVAALEALRRNAMHNRQTPGQYADELRGKHLNEKFVMANVKRHQLKLAVHADLDKAMGEWGAIWHNKGETDSMIQRRFFHSFGIDVVSVKALDKAAALAVIARIDEAVKRAYADDLHKQIEV